MRTISSLGSLRAIEAMKRCRTPDAGEVLWHCSKCAEQFLNPRSCGHRSCPQCQNHEATQWLERQREKLLPVEYFMVTFTLPYGSEGRPGAIRNSSTVSYSPRPPAR